MAYSPVENKYLSALTAVQFPTDPIEPEPAAPAAKPDQAMAPGQRPGDILLAEVGSRGLPQSAYTGQYPSEIKPYDPTVRERLAGFLQAGFEGIGIDRYKARQNAETLLGGPSSNLPLNIGLADFVPFLGTGLQTQEAVRMGEDAVTSAKQGNLGTAALQAGGAAVGLIPGAAGTVKAAKALPKNLPVGLSIEAVGGIEKALTPNGAKLMPDVEVQAAGDINAPAFKRWFSDSKVVDEKGQPLVVYHGTGKDFEAFQRQMGRQLFFSPDPTFAAEYAKSKGGNIMPVYVSAKKVWDFENPSDMKVLQKYLKLTDEEVALPQGFDAGEQYIQAAKGDWSYIESRDFQTFLKRNGYDGFYVEDAGVKNIGVFNPSQIKSVFNKGTWNPNDPRILHGAGGATAGTAATMQDKEKK